MKPKTFVCFKCDFCNKVVEMEKAEFNGKLKRSVRKVLFCGLTCFYKFNNLGLEELVCPQCNLTFYKSKSQLNDLRSRLNRENFYCSPKCGAKNLELGRTSEVKIYSVGSPIHRFSKRISINLKTGCWIWDAHVNLGGYGQLTINKKPYLAHRFSYICFNGAIPEGMCVCHRCDVRNCVNPDHLFLGTNQDNTNDMLKKSRAGHQTGTFKIKLTQQKADEIRELRKQGLTLSQIAEKYDINHNTVSGVINNKSWRILE